MGMFWGAAAGVALGLLLAPSTGAELRGQIADSADRFRRRAAKQAEGVGSSVNEMVGKGRQAYDRAMNTVDDLVDRGRQAVDKGREKFEEARADADQQFN